MVQVGVFLLTVALVGAALARWTRLHPLAVALLGALPGGIIGLIVAAGAMSTAAWIFALLSAIISVTAAALGAFLGWLRRTHVERVV